VIRGFEETVKGLYCCRTHKSNRPITPTRASNAFNINTMDLLMKKPKHNRAMTIIKKKLFVVFL
jgi:hypothetical protein